MSIFRRSNGFWYAYCPWRVKQGLPPKVSLETRDKGFARRLYEDLELKERLGESPLGKRAISLRDFIALYIEDACQPPKKTLKNCRQERFRLSQITAFFEKSGCGGLSQITIRYGERLVSHLAKSGLSSKTVNHYLGHLKTAFNTAVAWGYLRENPLKNLRPLKVTNVRAIRAFTVKEVNKIIACADDETARFIRLLFYTGLRLSELANLKFADIDFRRRILTVQASGDFSPKSRKVRHIPLSHEAIEFLKELPRIGEWIFSGVDGKKRYAQANNFTRRVRQAIETAGLYAPGIGPHAIRHTYISLLCASGASPTVVQQLAGHSDIHTTMRYVHQFPSAGRAEVEKLSLKRPKKSDN